MSRQRQLWFESPRPRRKRDDGLIVDSFAGGGGASIGISQALGRGPDLAINHNAHAIAMHAANHPETRHFCESVWQVDPVEATGGKPVHLAWFSPDCTHFSKARGGKPVSPRVRGLAWIVLRWAARVRPRVIILENVEEFVTWGPLTRKRGREKHPQPCKFRRYKNFRRWHTQLESLGYEVDYRELIAADYGTPTIRKRLFLIARCDGLPIVWPEKTHTPRDSAERNPELRVWQSAASCIEWQRPCPSIFLTPEEAKQIGVRRPLAEKTLARIANGIRRYVLEAKEPFIVRCNHGSTGFRGQGLIEPLCTLTASRDAYGLVVPYTVPRYGERDGQSPRCRSVEDPASTIVPTTNGDQLVMPHLSKYHGRDAFRGQSTEEPLRTQDTENRFALVSAFIAKHFGGMVGVEATEPYPTITQRATQNQIVATNITKMNFGDKPCSAADEPLHTIIAGGQTHALTASSLMKLRGTSRDGQPLDGPMHTVTGGGTHLAHVAAFLAKYYSSDNGKSGGDLVDPMATITSKDRLSVVTVMVNGEPHVITDIGMRMLVPRELYNAQGFPADYIITEGINGKPLTKTHQVAMCGNSVCPPVARALVEANCIQRSKRKAVRA